MNCKKCGASLDNNSLFCTSCGYKIEKKSKGPLILIICIGAGLLLIAGIILLIVMFKGNTGGSSNGGYNPVDEPLPNWRYGKPLRDSDITEAQNALKPYEAQYNTTFEVIRYFYVPDEACDENTAYCKLESVYVISKDYPQSCFSFCIREEKYGCEKSRNATAYSDAVKEYESKVAFYELAEELGISYNYLYANFNYVKGNLGADIVINNKVSIAKAEEFLEKFIKKTNSSDYYFKVFYVGKGDHKKYKNFGNGSNGQGLGIVDQGAFYSSFGKYSIYTVRDEDAQIKLINPKEVESSYNY